MLFIASLLTLLLRSSAMVGCAVASRTPPNYREQPARPWPLVHNPAMDVANDMPADRHDRQDSYETASIRNLQPKHRSDYSHRHLPSHHASRKWDEQVYPSESDENNSLVMIPQVRSFGRGHQEAHAASLYRPPTHLVAEDSYYQQLQEDRYGKGGEEAGSMWAEYLKHTEFAKQLLQQYARPDILYLLRHGGTHRSAIDSDKRIVLFAPTDYSIRDSTFCTNEGMRVMQHIVVLEGSEDGAPLMMTAEGSGQTVYESAAGHLLLLSRHRNNEMAVKSGSVDSQTARVIYSMRFPLGVIHVIDRMLELPLRFPEHVDQQLARTTLALVRATAISKKGESRGERRLAEAEREKDRRLTLFVYNQGDWPQLHPEELSMHVVNGVYTSASFPIDLAAPPHAKSSIYVESTRNTDTAGWTVNGRKVIRADILTTWGVVHVLDGPIPLRYIPRETAVPANADDAASDSNSSSGNRRPSPVVIVPDVDDPSLSVTKRPLAKP